MCNPVVIPLAIAAVQGIVQGVGSKQAADAQEEAQKKFAIANNQTAAAEMAQLRIRQGQEHEAAAVEKVRAERESRRARSTAEVALGESGVGGNAVAAILQDYGVQEGLYKASIARQLQLTDSQVFAEIEAVKANTAAENISMNKSSRPDYLGATATVISGALQSYGKYQESKTPKT